MLSRSAVQKHRLRRILRRSTLSISKILAVLLLCLTYIFHIEPNWYDVKNMTLTLPHLPAAFDRYRIVQLTDLHVDNFKAKAQLQKIVRLTARIQPDLVVMTGDYITGAIFAPEREQPEQKNAATSYQNVPYLKILEMITHITTVGDRRRSPQQYLPTLAAGLQQLHAPDGIVAVLGNHDLWDRHATQFMKVFQELGISVLANDVTKIQRGDEELQIAGVSDVMSQQADLQPILAKMGASQGAILLAHEPDFADVSAATHKFDLQLSGHSHGGQVYIPGLKRITPPLATKYPAGRYSIERMILYTSRGVGMVTPRVRFNCRPEITVVTLRSP